MALAEETGLTGMPHLGGFLDRLIDRFRVTATNSSDDETRRDFITEKLWDNPDAFASEYDVQALMSHFPGEF